MAEHYSDHYSTDVDALPLIPLTVPTGVGNAHMRWKMCTIELDTGFLNGDVVRLMQMRSSDRLLSATLSNDAAIVGGASANLCLHQNGVTHDGPEISYALFDGSVDLGADHSSVGYSMIRTAAVIGVNLGKPLWELGGFSSDPGDTFDLCWTVANPITTGGTCVVRAQYVSD